MCSYFDAKAKICTPRAKENEKELDGSLALLSASIQIEFEKMRSN